MERLTERDGLIVHSKLIGEFGSQTILQALAHYEDLEEQGRLIVLPCKVLDTVYTTEYGEVRAYTVSSFRVHETEMYAYSGYSYIGEVGESVFLTKEEAEKALAEMEKKDE